MKKVLLLSFIALIPCARLVGANNGTAPQLAGPESTVNSPIAPFTGMNDAAGATCPTEEEFMNALFQGMTPEEQAEFEEFAQMISQLPPEQQEQLGLLAIEETKNQALSTPEGQIGFVIGAAEGAAETKNKIAQELEAVAQEVAPIIEPIVPIIEEEIAKNQPYGPALK